MAPNLNTLARLRAEADAADVAFDAACRLHYADGRWGAYRAVERDPKSVPKAVLAAMDADLRARHAFYDARDGTKGFLGARGL